MDEDRLKLVIEISRAGTWETNMITGETIRNQNWYDTYGYSPDDQLPNLRYGSSIIHPEDYHKIQDAFNAHLEKRQPFCEYEVRLKHKDGRWVWVLGRSKVISFLDGQPEWVFGIDFDITERKEQEEALRKIKESQEILLDNLQSHVWYLTNDHTYGIVNKAHAAFFGFDKEKLAFKNLYSVFSKGAADICCEANKEVFEAGRPQCTEEWLPLGSKKEKRLFSIVKTPVFREDGSIEYVVCSAEDITNRKKAEQALQTSLSLLQATLESTADGILVVNLQGEVVKWNQKYCNLWNVPESVLMEKNDEKVLEYVLKWIKEPEIFLARVKQLYQNPEETAVDEIELVDGRVYERYSQPQRIGEEIIGRVWSFRDVTQQKRAEEELVHAKEKAEAASRAKSQFLSNMSHELRTPLTGIIGFADTLLTTGLNDDQSFLLNHIITASRALKEVVGNVLDISKIEAGKLELHPRLTDLSGLCNQVLSMVRYQANQKAIRLTLDFDTSISEVTIDPLRVQQVLLNLVANAVKFTPENGKVRISIKQSSSYPRSVRFEVTDTGIGIPQEDLDRVFLPFEQADGSVTRKHGGTGIGLTISSELLRLMGSSIHVTSEVGIGSTFFFELQC